MNIYRVDFIGREIGSIGILYSISKTLVFNEPKDFDEIIEEIHKTHEHIMVSRVTDLGKAAAFNEIKNV